MKANRSGILTNVFHLYDFCLTLSGTSKLKMTFLFGICYIELFIYSINTFYNSGFFNNGSIFSQIGSYVSYAQISSFANFGISVYSSIALTFKIITLLNLVFFGLLVLPQTSWVRFRKINTVYQYISFARLFIFFQPILEMVLRNTFTGNSSIRDSSPVIGLNMVVFITHIGLCILDTIFFQVEFFQKDNIFNTLDPYFYMEFTIYRIVLAVFFNIDFSGLPQYVFVTFSLLVTFAQLAFFVYNASISLFEKSFANILVLFLNGIFSVLLISLFTMNISSGANFIAVLILPFLLILILLVHLIQRKDQLFEGKKLKTGLLIIEHTNYLIDLGKRCEPSSHVAIILRGLLKRHEDKCVNLDCFCQQDSHYEASKNTFTEKNMTKHVNLITKYQVIQQLKNRIESYPNNHFLKYLLAEFYCRKMKNYTLANRLIIQLLHKNTALVLNFRIFRLQKQIFKDEEELNRERLKEKNFEELLRFEEAYAHVLMKISELYKTSLGFWNLVYGNFEISKSQFKETVGKILELKTEIKVILKILQNYTSFNKNLNFMLNFVRRELLNTKNEINLEDMYLMMKEDDRLSFASTSSILNNNFYTMFFNKMSCVVILEMGDQQIGLIKRASENVEKIFGYNRREILGQNVKMLMTLEIARNHDRILQRVAREGVFLSKTNSTYTYAIDKFKKPIKVKLNYKLNITLDSQIELCGVLVPVVSQTEENLVMIVNEFGFVTSISPALCNTLDISAENVKKNNFNIGMFNEFILDFLPAKAFLYKSPDADLNFSSTNKIFDKNIFHQVEFKVHSRSSQTFDKLFIMFQAFKEMTLENVKEIFERKKKYLYDNVTNRFLVESIDSDDSLQGRILKKNKKNSENTSVENLDNKMLINFSQFGTIITETIKNSEPNEFNSFFVDFEFIQYKRSYDIELFIFKILKINMKDVQNNKSHKSSKSKTMNESFTKTVQHETEGYEAVEPQTNQDESVFQKEKEFGELEISEAAFLSYLKQPLNLFTKEKKDRPIKDSTKISQSTQIIIFLVVFIIVTELVFLFLFKLPIITSLTSNTSNYKMFKLFETGIVNSYSDFLTACLDPKAGNYISQHMGNVLVSMKQAYIGRLIFNPAIDLFFVNAFEPNFNLTMDNTFLVENFVFFINQFSFADFENNPPTQSDYYFVMSKFKPGMLKFMKSLNTYFLNSIASSQATILLEYKVYNIVTGLVLVSLALTVFGLFQTAFKGITKIYETFLYISDAKIAEIGGYLQLSNSFLWHTDVCSFIPSCNFPTVFSTVNFRFL